ncbi:MAG: DUF3375 domain-containing protein [Nitrospirota bacterium]|nr:DUF3375 domain-containing protein [Nitrospirota bacterium]
MDHDYIRYIKEHNPTVRVLKLDNAPLIISFLFRRFKKNNRMTAAAGELTTELADYLHALREQGGDAVYPGTAQDYLAAWTNDGFLRKFYPPESDEALFELTPAMEKALDWIRDLEKKEFVGTESRLLKLFDLLKEIIYRSSADPARRLEELARQKREIEAEIEKIEAGIIERLNETQVKERFFEVQDSARKLLSDFRQIEYNFRELDRTVREKQIDATLRKGRLLDDVFKNRDLIRDTDQGRSFRAFWEFLMSQAKQDELDELIGAVLALPEISDMDHDEFLDRLKVGLIESGDKVNKTTHRLVEQLRKYLDDKAYLENKRIIEIINEIKALAVQVKDRPPANRDFFAIDDKPLVELVMERPLWDVPKNPELNDADFSIGIADGIDTELLYKQLHIDLEELRARIRELLKARPQVTLRQMTEAYPIEKGLAELIALLNIASKDRSAVINEEAMENVLVSNKETDKLFEVSVPQVIFCR